MIERSKILINAITSAFTLSVIAYVETKKIELPVEYAHITEVEMLEVRKRFGNLVLPLENVVKTWEERLLAASINERLKSLDLIAINGEAAYLWNNVKIYKTKLSNGRVINILKPIRVEGERFNRRKGVRIALNKTMLIQQEGKFYSVLVRDLSYCGLGFVVSGNSEIQTGSKFIFFLTEQKGDADKVIGKFIGKIINNRELPNGDTFYGCVLSSEHAAFLQRYIARKQMEELSVTRNHLSTNQIVPSENLKEQYIDALLDSLNM